MTKELLISILLFFIGCVNNNQKFDPLHDRRKLEQNKKRMDIEYMIMQKYSMFNVTPAIFLYVEDGFYMYREIESLKKINIFNKYKRYYSKKIENMNYFKKNLVNIMDNKIPIKEFIYNYLIKITDKNTYTVKEMVKTSLFDEPRLSREYLEQILLSAQYYYDFLIVVYLYSDFHEIRLFLPEEYCRLGFSIWQ